jgi:hypothetical protein
MITIARITCQHLKHFITNQFVETNEKPRSHSDTSLRALRGNEEKANVAIKRKFT